MRSPDRLRNPRLRLAAVMVVLLQVLLLSGCGRDVAAGGRPDFADLVQKVSPSVVNISAIGEDARHHASNLDDARPPDEGDGTPEWLRKYLSRHDQPPAGDAVPDDRADTHQADGDSDRSGDEVPQSMGSGFILSADGYILTNAHVIDHAAEVVVRLSDGRQLTARVVGSDRRSDLALLKIKAHGLPAVKIADVGKLRVGQWVLAIGSPFGFDSSVTSGIISAINRTLDTEQYVPFIQTDAAINPGNSGGPLFNMQGQVVGVNSQIYSQTGGFIGLAFAIPINVAMKVAHELKATGHVRRGWLGVVVQEVTRKLAASFDLAVPHGALITRVLPGSPAAQSGLRVGDVILSYDGTELLSSRDLPPLVGNSDPNQTVDLKLLREGKVVTMKVQLGLLGERAPEATPAAPADAPTKPLDPSLGLSMQSLPDGGSATAHGVLVTAVGAGAARDAGVLRGDVLLSLAGQPLDSPDRFRQIVGEVTPGRTVPLLVRRASGPLFLALTVPATR